MATAKTNKEEKVTKAKASYVHRHAEKYKIDPYELPSDEKNHVHACIVRHELDSQEGTPKFNPQIFKPNPQAWNNWLQHNNGFTVLEIYHLPEGAWTIKEFEEFMKEKAKKEEEARKRSQQS